MSDQHQHQRRSSVGKIALGDTSPSLSTMNTSPRQRRRSNARIDALSKQESSDLAILKKLFIAFRELSYRQTWIQPFILVAISLALYFLSGPESSVHKFLTKLMIPSYHIEGTDQYGKGENDFYFVFYYSLVFLFIREFVMCVFLKPLAVFFGITKEGKQKRFMEQFYVIFYTGISGPFGFWIMSQLPLWWFQTTPFYTNYPHKTHDFYFKIYYLGQAAFWVQQSVVLLLQLEKPRKDFKELVFHHVVTIALIWCSYRFHFTWMGLEVYITMDVSDWFLSVSKTVNYLNAPLSVQVPFFIIFMLVWIYLRHFINLKILWSVLTEFRTVGEWELNWITQQYKCWISQPIVFFLIFALHCVNLYWLFLIFRILYRIAVVGEAKDERSDDEEDEEEPESKKDQ